MAVKNPTELLAEMWQRAYTNVFKRHNIRILSWHENPPVPNEVESTCPRSYFDFIEDLELAYQEVAELLSR